MTDSLNETEHLLAAFHRIKANKLCRMIVRASGDRVRVRLSRDHVFPYNPSVDYSLLGAWECADKTTGWIEYLIAFADMADFAECLDAVYVAHMLTRTWAQR